ncbi:MAG: response regulator [Desulfobacterales bacterium]|nr:response regulator [Desulfobacterales bacterium]
MPEFNVLVVDDEEDFRDTLVKRLRKRNLDVQGVESGQKALELLDKVRFDVVILDVKMPGIDGVETLQEIKRKKPLIEVIMLTGHGSVEMGIQGMKLGAFEYVMKPADIDGLMEKMRRACKKKFFHEEKIRQTKEP